MYVVCKHGVPFPVCALCGMQAWCTIPCVCALCGMQAWCTIPCVCTVWYASMVYHSLCVHCVVCKHGVPFPVCACPCSMDQGKMFLFIGVVMILVQGEQSLIPPLSPPPHATTLHPHSCNYPLSCVGGYLRRQPAGREKSTALVVSPVHVVPSLYIL